jgi:molybdenum cofactor biosynthesis enzyme
VNAKGRTESKLDALTAVSVGRDVYASARAVRKDIVIATLLVKKTVGKKRDLSGGN